MGGKRQSLIPTFQQGQKEKISITKKATFEWLFYLITVKTFDTCYPNLECLFKGHSRFQRPLTRRY